MNKSYVTKEIAEKLRAKGYNVEELHYENSCLCIDEVYQTDNLRIYKFPRIDEVLAWLREEKKIFVEIVITPMGLYKPMIYDIGGVKKPYRDISPRIDFNEASIAGIEYVIDNLI